MKALYRQNKEGLNPIEVAVVCGNQQFEKIKLARDKLGRFDLESFNNAFYFLGLADQIDSEMANWTTA